MNKDTTNAFKAAFLAAQAKTAQKIEASKEPANSDKPKASKPDNTPKDYDNLRDIEQAAKEGKTISLLNLSNLVNQQPKKAEAPKPTPQAPAKPMPELSLFTVDDILTGYEPAEAEEQAPKYCTPQPFTMPEVKPAAKEETPTMKLVDYSDRSFAIVTAVKPSEEILNILRQHGSYNANLKCGKGWIFSKRHLQTVREKLGL